MSNIILPPIPHPVDTFASLPATPPIWSMWVTVDTGFVYIYNGAAYVAVSAAGPPAVHGSTHIAGGSDAIPDIESFERVYDCLAGIVVTDVVYQDASDNVAQADSATVAKMPAVGIVVEKPTATTAKVLLSGLYTAAAPHGLAVGTVWVGNTGALTTTAPEKPGHLVAQRFGTVIDATKILVDIEDHMLL